MPFPIVVKLPSEETFEIQVDAADFIYELKALSMLFLCGSSSLLCFLILFLSLFIYFFS